MPINPGLIVAGAGLLGSGINALSTSSTNKKNNETSLARWRLEHSTAVEDWHRQNTYNSPEQQMARLQKAGLNPNLVYGNGSATSQAGDVSQPHQAPFRAEAPQFDLQTPAQGYFNTQMQQAQLSNQAKQNTLLELEALKKVAETRSITADNVIKDINGKFLDGSYNFRMAQLQRGLALTNQNIDAVDARTQQSKAALGAINLDNEIRKSRRKGLDLDNSRKALENGLMKKGINPSDPIYIRAFSRFLDGKSTVTEILDDIGSKFGFSTHKQNQLNKQRKK